MLHIWLLLLASATAQFMPPIPQMPHPPYPFYPHGQQMAIQMPHMPGMMPQVMMPNMPQVPGMHPMHMPSMQLPLNGGRLPMVVMPHHTKKDKKKPKKHKKRYHKRVKPVSSSSEDSCSSEEFEFRSRHDAKPSKKKRREVLTPVVSYVTKDGYVIYQKKIKKEKAKDWLELSKGHSEEFSETSSRGKKRHKH